MRQTALQLQHGPRDLVTKSGMALVVVNWCNSVVMSGTGTGIAATQTGHEGWARGAGGGSCASVVMHIDGGCWVLIVCGSSCCIWRTILN
jgi:hypothetical protein